MALKEKDIEAHHTERVRSHCTVINSIYANSLQVSDDDKYVGGKGAVPDHTTPGALKEESRIVRKIDFRLLPTLATIYAFALIDRVNLPNVSILKCYI